jgi:formiminotetrahydrofolate cyclodeaminase
MQSPISESTLDSFRAHVAGAKDPIAGGVAVAAVSGSLGMALLALTLKVASRRKDFSGDRARLAKLLQAANKESARLVRYADRDIAAYQKYRDCLKRKRGVETALTSIIESPLIAAASAAKGVDICEEALHLAPLSVVSDLGAAATVLAGSVRAILLTVDVNLRQLPLAAGLRRKGGKTRRVLERGSVKQLERILKQVGDLLQSY